MPDTSISKTQVIISGAGPTGLSLAVQLLRYNVDFVILDKKETTTIYSKALVVQARSMEILQEIDLSQKAIAEGQMTTGLALYYKGKRRAAVDLASLGEGVSEFPFALSLEQSKTEKLLADRLAEQGKQVLWKTEWIRYEENVESVIAYVKGSNGQEQKIVADYLVGCDGASSIIRHQMQLPFKGSTEPKLFYVADVFLTSSVIKENKIYMFLLPQSFVLFFPMVGSGHYRIVGVLPPAADGDAASAFPAVAAMIKQRIKAPVDFTELRWYSTYKVHSRMAESFMQGRCFIAGDAAHIHTPAGGQGMNTGIQDAYNLAWKLAFALRGEINQQALASYSTERSANARHLLQTTDRIFDIMSGVNSFWNFLRLTILPPLLPFFTSAKFFKKRVFPLISQTGISYPDSHLTSTSSLGTVKAGDRIHYFLFADGTSIFSHLKEPVFKLLFFGEEEKNKCNQINTSGIRLVTKLFTEIPTAIFGNERNFYLLLRPDNHVSYIGKDPTKCAELLQRLAPAKTRQSVA